MKRDPQNGNIVFLGRADSQVKIRGYRVELEEIESHLTRMPGVRSSVAVVQLNQTTEAQELVAFVVEESPNSFNVNACRTVLQQDLPYYCIPMVFCIIEASIIDVSPISGKVLRKNLPHWSSQHIAKDDSIDSGTTVDRSTWNSVDLILFELFFSILGIALQLDENVFNNGFNSVSGARLISICRSEHAWTFLKMKDVYDNETIRSLSLFVSRKLDTDANDANGDAAILMEGFAVGASCSVVPNLLRSDGSEHVPSSAVLASGGGGGGGLAAVELPWELVPRYWTVTFLQMMTFVWFAFAGNGK